MSLLRRRMMMNLEEEASNEMEWEIGALSIWGGEEIDDSKKIRTKGFYPIEAGTYEINHPSKSFCYFLYKNENEKPYGYGGYYTTKAITCDTDCYLRLLIDCNDLSLGKTIIITKKRLTQKGDSICTQN